MNTAILCAWTATQNTGKGGGGGDPDEFLKAITWFMGTLAAIMLLIIGGILFYDYKYPVVVVETREETFRITNSRKFKYTYIDIKPVSGGKEFSDIYVGSGFDEEETAALIGKKITVTRIIKERKGKEEKGRWSSFEGIRSAIDNL